MPIEFVFTWNQFSIERLHENPGLVEARKMQTNPIGTFTTIFMHTLYPNEIYFGRNTHTHTTLPSIRAFDMFVYRLCVCILDITVFFSVPCRSIYYVRNKVEPRRNIVSLQTNTYRLRISQLKRRIAKNEKKNKFKANIINTSEVEKKAF